jgi:hypothetical protein
MVEADRMLSEHFTSAIGVKAQRYEPMVQGGNVAPEEIIMSAGAVHARARWVDVDAMLRDLDPGHRSRLQLVYAFGTDTFSADESALRSSGRAVGLVQDRNLKADKLGLLRVALSPTEGHGSFVRLAILQDRTRSAFARRYPNRPPTHDAVLDFLAFEAGRGDASSRFLAEVRNDCQAKRDLSLRAFAQVVSESRAKRRAREDQDAQRESQRLIRASERVRAKIKATRQDLGFTDEHRTGAIAKLAALLYVDDEVAS